MDRKLQGIEVLPEVEAVAVLELDGLEDLAAEEPLRDVVEQSRMVINPVVRFALSSDPDGSADCGGVLVKWMYDADGDSQNIVDQLSRMEEGQLLRPRGQLPVLYSAVLD